MAEGPWSDFTAPAAPEKAQETGPWSDFAKPSEGLGIMSLPSDVAEGGARVINAIAEKVGATPRDPQPFSWQKADAANPNYTGIIPIAKEAVKAAELPGDVAAGRVDPLSEEGIKRAAELSTLVMSPSAGAAKSARAVVRPGKGPEAEAGKIIEKAATDVEAVRSKLAQPQEIIEGSQPTTHQLTGDPGLGQLERVSQTRSQDAFQTRRAEQNTARLQALEGLQKSGSPEDVASHLRGILKTHEAEIAADLKLAETQAWEKAQALGGAHDPTTYGNVLRQELQGAEQIARKKEGDLWKAIDPNGDLMASARPMQELERSIYGTLGPAAQHSITPAEAGINKVIQEYPGVLPFKEMTDLRSLVSSEMRQEVRTNGKTPAYARMAQLRAGIENAITAPVWEGLTGEFTTQAAQRVQAASAATRERAGRFNVSPIRDILRSDGLAGMYRVQEGAIPGRLIKPGPAGYDSATAYLRAVGPQQGVPVLQDAVAADMRRSVIGADGLVDVAKLGTWTRRYQDVLRAIDDVDHGAFSQMLRDAGQASNVVEQVAARRATTADNVARSEFGKLVGAADATDISRIIGGLFGSQQSVAKARALSQMLTTPAAKEGAQRAVIDFVRDRFISNTEAGATQQGLIRADQFQTFVQRNRAALSQIMTPEQVNGLGAIAADIQRANRSLNTKMPGASNTAQDLTLMAQQKATSWLSHLLGHSRTAMVARLGLRIGRATMEWMRDAGVKTVQDLVDKAMLDPAVARALLQSAGGELVIPGLKRWSMYQLAPAAAVGTANSKSRYQRGGVTHRAGGGDTDQLPQATAAPPDAPAHNIMVPGVLYGDHYEDGSGHTLEGAPDANGMMALPLHADSTYAGQPQNYGFGPPYNDSSTLFQGTPFAPEIGGFGGAPAPAGAVNYDPSTNIPMNWQDFDGKGTSTGGGFFNFDQIYAGRGEPVPHAFQSGSSLPSTNNYRLLPPQYQKPNYVMRNGNIIDMNQLDMFPENKNWNHSGSGFGFPTLISPNRNYWLAGWPGSRTWAQVNNGNGDGNRGGIVGRSGLGH